MLIVQQDLCTWHKWLQNLPSISTAVKAEADGSWEWSSPSFGDDTVPAE